MGDPFIEKEPSILNKPDGSVLFECMVNGNPEPDVKWMFKNAEIPNDDRHIMKKKKMVGKYACTLHIKVFLIFFHPSINFCRQNKLY